MFKEKIYI